MQPSIHTHPKFLALKARVGIGAMHYLTKLWAFCQSDQRGQRIGKLSPEFVEALCEWSGESGALFTALTSPLTPSGCGWLEVDEKGVYIAHDWNDANAGLVANWRNGTKNKKDRKPRVSRGLSTDQPSPDPITTSVPPLDRIGSDRIGSDRIGEKKIGWEGGGTPAREPVALPPTLDVVLAHARSVGWPYTDEAVRRAWLEFEAAKLPDGSWAWGKRAVTDWRHALEVRLSDSTEKNPPPTAINGRLMTITRRLAEIEDSPLPEEMSERRALKREQAQLLEQQKKAAQS